MNQNRLNIGIKKNAIRKLEYNCKSIKNFDSLNDEMKKLLEKKAKLLKKNIYNKENLGKDYFYNFLIYLFNYRNLNEVKTMEERLALLIEVLDPDFEIFKSFETNSKMKDIKNQALENLGFFNSELIRIEKLYIEKFYNINDFLFTKKLQIK